MRRILASPSLVSSHRYYLKGLSRSPRGREARVLAILLCFFIHGNQVFPNAHGCPQTPPGKQLPSGPIDCEILRILKVLPPDTESVIVDSRPAIVDESGFLKLLNHDPVVGPVSLLHTFQTFSRIPRIRDEEIGFCVVAARSFRRPRELGLVRFDGALFISLKTNRTSESTLAAKCDRRLLVSSRNVYQFSVPLESDTWTLLATMLRPGLLLIASDYGFLRDVLIRSETNVNVGVGLPFSLEEWHSIRQSAPLWGIRHFRQQSSGLDPTSPYNENALIWDTHAIGITFNYEPSHKRLSINYFTFAPHPAEPLEAFKRELLAHDARVEQHELKEQVALTIAVTVDNGEEILFVTIAILGFAVFV